MAKFKFIKGSLSGSNLYNVLYNENGQVWNGATAVDLVEADWANYDLPMTESGSTGVFLSDIPDDLPAGEWSVVTYRRVGAAPIKDDDIEVGYGTHEVAPAPDEEESEITLEDRLLSPKRMRTEEGSIEERSVQEMIEADRYLQTPVTSPPWGAYVARVKPGGTTPGA